MPHPSSNLRYTLCLGLIVALLTCLLSSGCQKGGIQLVETLIGQGDYLGALKASENLPSNDPQVIIHQAFLYLIVGDTVQGWKTLDKVRSLVGTRNAADALWEASLVIVREKRRLREVVMMWDSLLTWEPERRSAILGLAWQRGVEYLGMRGDGGRVIFDFIRRHDPLTVNRLQAFNPSLYRRFQEMDRVYARVIELTDLARKVMKIQNGVSQAHSEFLKENAHLTEPFPGWVWEVEETENGFCVVARAGSSRPGGVPFGTEIRP